MSKDHGQGIFEMSDITLVCSMSSLPNAKVIARAAIDRSTATQANKDKAGLMVAKATSPTKLAFGMTNFSLAHQGLKVL
jgi:hypothetical protein